jgi:hypothetical protein
MAELVRDLATYDRAKVDRNISDLLWFYESSQEAVQVGREFLFSVSADLSRTLVTNESYDSLEILWHLLTSFDRSAHAGTGAEGATVQLNSGNERNRFVVIGGYGWGKSTLALVAAQLLGLPAEDEGQAAVVSALDPESGEAPRQLVDKVNSRSPKFKFTVCIKGANRNFHDLFIAAVAASKKRYKEILEQNGVVLTIKSEYEAAIEWLRKLADAPGFEAILQKESIPLPGLLTGLADLDPDMLARADRVWQRYNRVDSGVQPVWYQQVDTAKYLGELVEDVTGATNSPFDGVLVLFDELGLWLGYANDNENLAGGPAFLSFMEAAQRYRNKLTICSFIQADIEAFVGRDSASNNVRHMSERLGVRVRYRADLERVFQSAIKQNKDGRKELWTRHESDFEELAGRLTRVFEKYRAGTWAGTGRVKDVLVKRSWPIHPFMVAAVCHLRFGQGHRVIQILEDQFPKLNDRLIEDDTGTLSWSLPIDVVDFYQANFENLHSADGERKLWDRYAHAKNSLRVPEDDPTVKVLKAVFLAHALAGSMRVNGSDEFVELIGLLSGLSEDLALRTLSSLSSSHGTSNSLLLLNDANGWYEFFTLEQNPAEAREYVIKKYEEATSFEFLEDFQYFGSASLSPSVFAQGRHIQVHGYQSMYEAVVDVNNLNPNYLATLAFTKILGEVDPPYRGIHLVVLYSEEKKPVGLPVPDRPLSDRVREYCQKALNEAWRTLAAKGDEVPIVLSVPNEPPNDLYRALGLIRSAKYVPPEDAKRLGEGLSAFREIERRRVERIVPGWASASKLMLLVPESSVDSRLASINVAGNKATIVGSLFNAVFPHTPPLNHNALGGSGTRFVKYVRSLMEFLCNPQRQRNMPQEHANALDSVLLSTNALADRNWMVVDETASGFTVVPPRNEFASRCYQHFDADIRSRPVGSHIPLKDLWKKFSRAPYGLDIRSLLLMFGVWYATHRDECFLHNYNGDRATWETLVGACERRNDMFGLVTTGNFSLQLRDAVAELTRVRDLLAKLQAWRPGDTTAERLLAEKNELAGISPDAAEWNQIDRETNRIQQSIATESQQFSAIQDLSDDITRNCRLENLTDFTRRLNGLALQTPSSARARTAVVRCLEQVLARAEESAAGAISQRYSGPEIERHELERAEEFIKACALTEVAKTIDPPLGEQVAKTLDRVFGDLSRAADGIDAKHKVIHEEGERIATFKKEWEEALSQALEGSAGLKVLMSTSQKLEQMRPACPASLRSDFERSCAVHDRRTKEVSSAISSWASAFEREQSPEAVALLLAKSEEILGSAEGTDLEQVIDEVTQSKQVYVSAAEAYTGAIKSLSAGPAEAEAALPVMRQAEGALSEARRAPVTKWRVEVEKALGDRRVAADRRVKELEVSLAKAVTPELAMRAQEDINIFDREHGAYAPASGEHLSQILKSLLAENAPAQIAVILRPVAEGDRKAIIEKALALVPSLRDGQ